MGPGAIIIYVPLRRLTEGVRFLPSVEMTKRESGRPEGVVERKISPCGRNDNRGRNDRIRGEAVGWGDKISPVGRNDNRGRNDKAGVGAARGGQRTGLRLALVIPAREPESRPCDILFRVRTMSVQTGGANLHCWPWKSGTSEPGEI